ncbi:hypothetical protein SIPHO035v1_p0013 [Vibrio phage 234P7B]|nr:hypothetical protein SIPHO035v1_p0013 [Vibrio phage 234P7B]
MSYLNEKTLDIVLEEYADFGYQLRFSQVNEECTPHPVTGEPTNCKEVSAPLPVDTLVFTGSISDSLGDDRVILEDFTISMISAAGGVIEMILSKAQVIALAGARPISQKAGERQRLIGYYDLICFDAAGDVTTRIIEGKVYVSDGVTT